jgi:NAD(P)-dependent dehydrogenase (short-subunit alcohol dehydrogenase family)
VTGGSGALGSEICRTLAEMGFDLAFTYYRNEGKAAALKKECSAFDVHVHALPCDLSGGGAAGVVDAARDALQGLDGLVIASGISTGQEWQGKQPDFFEVTDEGYDRMMSVNVRGVFFMCQRAAHIMKENNGGRIVITGSIDGVKPVPAPADYACCKGALWGLAQSLAKELGPFNILVNMIAPGVLEGGVAEMLSPRLLNEYVKHSALRRVGRFSEVANMAAFLVSPDNTYMTGQAVILDGGL